MAKHFYMRRILDNPVVFNHQGDIEKTLKALKRRVSEGKIFGALKFRNRFPSKGDRRRAKALAAIKRLERTKQRGNFR